MLSIDLSSCLSTSFWIIPRMIIALIISYLFQDAMKTRLNRLNLEYLSKGRTFNPSSSLYRYVYISTHKHELSIAFQCANVLVTVHWLIRLNYFLFYYKVNENWNFDSVRTIRCLLFDLKQYRCFCTIKKSSYGIQHSVICKSLLTTRKMLWTNIIDTYVWHTAKV